jgi:hypothetical protein
MTSCVHTHIPTLTLPFTKVSGKTKEELSLQAITPNPAKLPGLFLVGEAFSPFQGWTEGALWTAEKAAGILVGKIEPSRHSGRCSVSPFKVTVDLHVIRWFLFTRDHLILARSSFM